VVGLPISREEAISRVITAAQIIGQEPARKTVYVAYCNKEAIVATQIARFLEQEGISTWIATQDCRVGDNWRQAQVRGVLSATVQVIVLDGSVIKEQVLRTEILLAEAFGLRVLTVLGAKLSKDARAVTRLMAKLHASDITYRRLTDLLPFTCDQASVVKLANKIRRYISAATSKGPRGGLRRLR
jgi:hypothetical protein